MLCIVEFSLNGKGENLMKNLFVFCVNFLFFLLLSANADLTSIQMVQDLNELSDIIKNYYAPLQFKEKKWHLDWDKEIGNAKTKFTSGAIRNDEEFYSEMAKLLAKLKDAHVNTMVPSAYSVSLGFETDFLNGKVLISYIDTDKLNQEYNFPLEVGDELLGMSCVKTNNQAKDNYACIDVKDIMYGNKEKNISGLSEYISTGNLESGNKLTDNRLLAIGLTTRYQAKGFYPIPKGLNLIKIKKKDGKEQVVQMIWLATGEPLPHIKNELALNKYCNNFVCSSPISSEKHKKSERDIPRMEMGHAMPFFKLPKGIITVRDDSDNDEDSEDLFYTGVYEKDGVQIGLLRIPTYNTDNTSATDHWLMQYSKKLEYLQTVTDVLVIDQTYNGGGSLDFVNALAALFVNEYALQPVTFKLRVNLRWINIFNTEIIQLKNGEAPEQTIARLEYQRNELTSAYEKGEFLSPPIPFPFLGQYLIQSYYDTETEEVFVYRKPIVFLINEKCFSAADIMSAILRDNERAVLFGTQTAGAGGNVRQYGPLANSSLFFTVTESLMVRPEESLFIENQGIRPQIEYQITEEDFNNGFEDYVKTFTDVAIKVARGEIKPEREKFPSK
jgi:hypothetical protein